MWLIPHRIQLSHRLYGQSSFTLFGIWGDFENLSSKLVFFVPLNPLNYKVERPFTQIHINRSSSDYRYRYLSSLPLQIPVYHVITWLIQAEPSIEVCSHLGRGLDTSPPWMTEGKRGPPADC